MVWSGVPLGGLLAFAFSTPADVCGQALRPASGVGPTAVQAAGGDGSDSSTAERRGVLTFLGQAFRDGARFTLFGAPSRLDLGFRTTRAFLYGDNGTDRALFFVANSYASTRLTANLDIELSPLWRLHFDVKLPLEIDSSNDVDFDQGGIDFQLGSFDTERHGDISFISTTYGTWYLGYGSTASDGSSEVDFSGTTVIASSKSRNMAGGLSFFGGGPHIKDVFDNFDGLGDKVRVRYDTPEWNGYRLSGSIGAENNYDAALRYQAMFDGASFGAAFAYAYSNTGRHQLSASGSLRTGDGLSTTLAAGVRFNGGSVPLFFYGKLAWQFDLFEIGATAFGADFTYNRSVGISGADAINYGVFAVQSFVAGGFLDSADLYVGLRNHHLWLADSVDCQSDCTVLPSSHSIAAVMAGFRLLF